jgi:simple sugar transport system permease protein
MATEALPATPQSAAATRYTKQTRLMRLRKSSAFNVTALLVVLLVGLGIWTLVNPSGINFYASGNLSVLSQQLPIIALLAMGAGVLMVAGEFDLSVAGMFTLAPYLLSLGLTDWNLGLGLSLVIALAVAVTVGLLNAAITLRLQVPSFIATLGMMFILRGVVRWVSISAETGQPDQIALQAPAWFVALMTGQIAGPLHAQALWLIGFGLFTWVMLNRSVLGNHIFAVGGDAEAARKTGISVARTKTAAFVFCTVAAAIAGLFQTARVGMVDPIQTLSGLELQAIAAAVIGGVYLFGGRGAVWGMLMGAGLLVVIQNLLIMIRAPGEYMPVFVGTMVILSVILNSNIGGAAGRTNT